MPKINLDKFESTGERSTIAAEIPKGPATRSIPKIGRSNLGSGKKTQWKKFVSYF